MPPSCLAACAIDRTIVRVASTPSDVQPSSYVRSLPLIAWPSLHSLCRFPLLAAGLTFALSPAVPLSFGQTELATWRARADRGDAEALNALGNAYALGQGVPRDDGEALRFYEAAARQSYAPACFNLGLIYELGRGVPRNETEAVRWYRQAAAQNHPRASLQLALMLEDGRGVARDEAEAARLYRISAEQGVGAAQTNLGLMLAAGRGGLEINLPEAYVWLSLAVEAGAPSASRDLVQARLSPLQREEAERLLGEVRTRLAAAVPVVPVASVPVSPPPVADAVVAPAAVFEPVAPLANPSADDTSRADLRAEVVQLRTENRELTSALAEAEREARRLKQALASANTTPAAPAPAAAPEVVATAARLTAENASLQTELVTLRSTVEEKLQVIAALTDEVTALKAAPPAPAPVPVSVPEVTGVSRADADLLVADASALRAQVESLTDALATRTQERDAALASAASTPAQAPGVAPVATPASDEALWTARLAAANQISIDLQADIAALTAENAALQADVVQLRSQIAALTGTVRILRGDNARLAAQVGVAPATGAAPVVRLPLPVMAPSGGRTLPTRPGTVVSFQPAAPVTPAPSALETRFHTVVAGESLSRISQRYYGNGRRWTEIFEANRDTLRTPHSIQPGQRLRIP